MPARNSSLIALALFVMQIASPAFAELRVHTYSSPDPDSVNTYAIETSNGLVVISTQRTFSQASLAVARVDRIGLPVVAIVIPVPHTDHFGGLGIFREAFPDATVHASAATIQSLRTDGEGYIASRKAVLGDDFPSQAQVLAALPDKTLEDGKVLDFGDVQIDVIEVSNANAPSNTMLYVEDEGVLFSVEVVEDGVTAFLKDADLDGWIGVLQTLPQRFPDLEIVYPAHNAPAPGDFAVEQQLAHLIAYRDVLHAVLEDGTMSEEERRAAVTSIEAAFPDHARVARLEREVLIGLNLDWQAQKILSDP